MKKSIQEFFGDDSKWKKEYALLREIILTTDLEEELKWGKPCYTYNGDNIVLIHGFKNYCALLFHKGALLNDSEKKLIRQTKNVQSARQLRFNSIQEIKEQEKMIKEYVYEAVELEKQGLEVMMKKTKDYETPTELKEAFQENPDFKKAFRKLTPGRQRGYLLYFSEAKQAKTRKNRIEKYKEHIFIGKGKNDR